MVNASHAITVTYDKHVCHLNVRKLLLNMLELLTIAVALVPVGQLQ